MKNSIVAKTYALAVAGVSEKTKAPIFDEVAKFIDLLNKNQNLEQVLFLNVFTEEEKTNVLKDIFEKMESSELLKNFFQFLIQEKRIGLLPQIYKELVVIEDSAKGFLKVSVEGSQQELDKSAQKSIEEYLHKKLNLKSHVSYKKNENISAGYKVTAGDYLLDATLKTQLNNFKNGFFE